MPVDPALQPVLAQLAQAPAAPSLEDMRTAVIANALRSPRRPVTLGEVRDLTLPGPDGPLPARLYYPAGTAPAQGWPLTVYFHGGGFVAYNLDTHDPLCRELCAASGGAVLSVDYRLAPEHKFPAATRDAYASVQWAAAHAGELGTDPTRLAVAGDSAGASLAIAATLRARDEGGPRLRAQLLIYPPTDATPQGHYPSRRENATGYFLTAERMKFYGQMYVQRPEDAAHPHVSPMHADLAGLPPALVLTAEYDPLRDEGRAYAEALSAAGTPAEHRPGPGMIHGFANMTGFSPAAAQLVDDAGAWLGEQLRQ